MNQQPVGYANRGPRVEVVHSAPPGSRVVENGCQTFVSFLGKSDARKGRKRPQDLVSRLSREQLDCSAVDIAASKGSHSALTVNWRSWAPRTNRRGWTRGG